MTLSVSTAALLHIHAAATAKTRKTPTVKASTQRRKLLATTFLATASIGLAALHPQASVAGEKWGSRSFIWEKYFQPGLSPEDAVARIRQTAEGLHDLRYMVDRMAWRYIIFYIRVKQSYLDRDLKNAMSTLPEARRQEYVDMANDLVANMAKLDDFVRTPKVYESYLYYEKTLKAIDKVVELL